MKNNIISELSDALKRIEGLLNYATRYKFGEDEMINRTTIQHCLKIAQLEISKMEIKTYENNN